MRDYLDARKARAFARPIGFNALGKIGGAFRDLSPLVAFGVGSKLDASVLAVLVGASITSATITLVVPLCVPLMATGNPRSTAVVRRFLLSLGTIGLAALLAIDPILRGLGAPTSTGQLRVLYVLAILAALIQVVTSVISAAMYADGSSSVGLAFPLLSGLAVPLCLIVDRSLLAIGVGLASGAIGDLVLVAAVRRRTRGRRTTSATQDLRGRARFEFLVLSSLLTWCVIWGERALMSRGAVGVVGIVAVMARIQASAVVLVSGSLEPHVVRRAAIHGDRDDVLTQVIARWTRRAGFVSGVVCVCGAVLLEVSDAPLPLTTALLYAASLPTAALYRLCRAMLYGRQRFFVDMSLVGLGGLLTLSCAAFALSTHRDNIFALAVPLSSAVVALVGGSYIGRPPEGQVLAK